MNPTRLLTARGHRQLPLADTLCSSASPLLAAAERHPPTGKPRKVVRIESGWLHNRGCGGSRVAIVTVVEPHFENGARSCDNQGMTKAELHELVDRLPDGAVDGAAVLLGDISAGRIDPEQAWFWTREWQEKEREADDDRAAGRVMTYENDAEFLAALDERTKPLDADA